MPKENRVVSKIDLIPSKIYSENRKEYRKKLVQFKKDRRIPLGPYATFYFESYETMLGQIQEMLYIEKGGAEQLKDELEAYNPLIPKGKELVATLMSVSNCFKCLPANGQSEAIYLLFLFLICLAVGLPTFTAIS